MTIERVINHGIAYLRLTASLGLKKVEGRVVQRRKVVLSLGPMSRHDDGKPDYLRRLRESYRAGRPLIKELEPYVDGAAKGRVTVTFNAGDPTCLGKPRRMAATVLGPESGEEQDWTDGLPGARLANALREWQVTELPGDYYQMLNASDGDIVTLFKAFGIDVPAKIYTKGDLRELKSAIDPF